MHLNLKRLAKNIERDRKRQDVKIRLDYVSRQRYIPQKIYCELKSIRVCEHCHKSFNHPLEIHHKVPHSKGGSNSRNNLIAVCNPCHRFLDGAK